MSEKTKRRIFQVCFVLFACIIIETVLRVMGYRPGDISPNWLNFKPVEKLEINTAFYVNHDALMVARSGDIQFKPGEVNNDGFRSPDFSVRDSTKKKLLLIGDSFTWGFSATPVADSSFADIIRNETNYEVYNTGIPTADPVQYAAIAEKYVPELKPDVVFVMFFMGNDLMKENRELKPDSMFFYFTNAGCLQADIDGKHFPTAQAAYNYITNEKYYIGKNASLWQRLISKSALLSRLYAIRFRITEKQEFEHNRLNTSLTKQYLSRIKNTCIQNQATLRFVLIPEIKEADHSVSKMQERYADLFSDNELADHWMIPQCRKKYFNDYPDAHLNNAGHRFYAEYLKAFLKKEEQ